LLGMLFCVGARSSIVSSRTRVNLSRLRSSVPHRRARATSGRVLSMLDIADLGAQVQFRIVYDRRDMGHYADDLAALTAHLNLENAVHVGHSAGGGRGPALRLSCWLQHLSKHTRRSHRSFMPARRYARRKLRLGIIQ